MVTYNYKIRLSDHGEILNSDCECPAGKGPHGTCKHIASVIMMLEEFTSSGHIKIQKACTENLQHFHVPKRKYKGSPVKVESMNIHSKKKCSLEDPRPPQFILNKSYNSHVRSTILNFCSSTSKDISMRYLYDKANIEVAALDHDYLDLPYTQHWVDEANKVSEVTAREIEEITRGQSGSKKWFRERQWRLTASRFGEICHMTDRRNREKLCESLLFNKKLSTTPVLHGIQFEETARKEFQKVYDVNVCKSGLFVRSDFPYLGATPDGVVDSESMLEIKCPYNGRNEKIVPSPNFSFLEYDSKNCVKLKTSSNYYVQIQGQLFITQRNFCFFVVYTFQDLFIEIIKFDDNFCKHCMIPKLDLFYTKYFRKYIAENL